MWQKRKQAFCIIQQHCGIDWWFRHRLHKKLPTLIPKSLQNIFLVNWGAVWTAVFCVTFGERVSKYPDVCNIPWADPRWPARVIFLNLENYFIGSKLRISVTEGTRNGYFVLLIFFSGRGHFRGISSVSYVSRRHTFRNTILILR